MLTKENSHGQQQEYSGKNGEWGSGTSSGGTSKSKQGSAGASSGSGDGGGKGGGLKEIFDEAKRLGVEMPENDNLAVLKARIAIAKQCLKEKQSQKKQGFRAKRDAFREKLKDAPDGTYDFETGEAVSFVGQKKWQVSFQTTASEDKNSNEYLTDDEYDSLVDRLSKETGSKPYLGKFEALEISFACDTEQQALDIAREFNQMSVWNWERMEELVNPFFDPTNNTVKGDVNNGKRI